jgi:DNA-binding transcriptional LysR family regulator
MELRHLRYFIAVAEAENVTRAALKLHVSQPGLSRQVRDLEDELGFALFKRSAKSVKLTEAGAVFLKEARAVLERAGEAVQAARAVATGRRGEVHIGYAPSLTARILPPTLRAFQTVAPGVRVKLHDLATEEMLTGLRTGKLHLALMVKPDAARMRGFQFHELARDPFRVAVSPKHALGRRRSVSLAQITREPLVIYSRQEYPEYYASLAEVFSAVKATPVVAEEHDSVTSLIAAVEAGNGIALVSESVSCIAGVRLRLIPLSPAPDPYRIGAAWVRGNLAPPAEMFLEAAKKIADSVSVSSP